MYECLFHSVLNYSVMPKRLDWMHLGHGVWNEMGTSVPDPLMVRHLVHLYWSHLCWKPAYFGLLLEDGMWSAAYIALGWGVEPYEMSLLPLFLVTSRCEENHLLCSCFLAYSSHSPLSATFSPNVFASTILKTACCPSLSSLTVATNVWFLFKMPEVSGI